MDIQEEGESGKEEDDTWFEYIDLGITLCYPQEIYSELLQRDLKLKANT